jgi:hypothetical protein
MNQYLPNGFRIGGEEVAPRVHDLVVRTPTSAYKYRHGITLDTETGRSTDPTDEALSRCKECGKIRDEEEMPKHQKRHDSYRAAYEKNPWKSCSQCKGQGGYPCRNCNETGLVTTRGPDFKPNGYKECENCEATGTQQCWSCKGAGIIPKRRPQQ